MRNMTKLAIAAVVTAAAVTGAAVVFSTQNNKTSEAAPIDAQEVVRQATALEAGNELMRAILLPADEHPAGTQLNELSLADAAMQMLSGTDPSVVVSPGHCVDHVLPLFGDPTHTPGWVQLGARESGDPFSARAASVRGGVTAAELRAAANDCSGGTVNLTKLGITGTFSLIEVPAPTLERAETFALRSRIVFPEGLDAAAIAQALSSCGSEPNSTVVEAKVRCVAGTSPTQTEVAAILAAFTHEQHFVYVSMGETLVEACEAQLTAATTMAQILHGRALAQS